MSAANTCRAYLGEAVQAAYPSWKVETAPAEPGQVRRGVPFLAIWRATLNPGDSVFNLSHSMELDLYGSKDANDSDTEEELEGYLDQLLTVLESLELFQFREAERMTFKNVFQGYKITGSITTENIYRKKG